MSYGYVEDLCLYEIAGCPILLEDGTSLGIIEGLKRHKGSCEVLLVKTEDDRDMYFPLYQQVIVECRPYECLIVAPPDDLLKMYQEGRQPENPCEIVRREVAASKEMSRAA
jgi:hypothetical protein